MRPTAHHARWPSRSGLSARSAVQRFWSVLELSEGPTEDRFVGQVGRMHESRCFRASGGRLGCISCHDPHELPEPEEKVRITATAAWSATAIGVVRSHPRSGWSGAGRITAPAATCAFEELRHPPCRHDGSSRLPPWGRDRTAIDPGLESARRLSTAGQFPSSLMDDWERDEANRDIGVALCREARMGAAWPCL